MPPRITPNQVTTFLHVTHFLMEYNADSSTGGISLGCGDGYGGGWGLHPSSGKSFAQMDYSDCGNGEGFIESWQLDLVPEEDPEQ